MKSMWRFVVRNRYLSLACLVLVVAVVVEGFLVRPPQKPPEEAASTRRAPSLCENSDLIKPGMTVQQVEKLLGPPASTQEVFDTTQSVWMDEHKNICVIY